MPTPVNYQANSMPTHLGLAAGLDANGFLSNIAVKPRIVAKTANYTVLTTESGTIFTTQGATANVQFTLPAVAGTSGCIYLFYNCENVNLTVTDGAVDTMTAYNDVAADSVAFSSASKKVGGGFLVFSDGTNWHSAGLLSSDVQVITVAT